MLGALGKAQRRTGWLTVGICSGGNATTMFFADLRYPALAFWAEVESAYHLERSTVTFSERGEGDGRVRPPSR